MQIVTRDLFFDFIIKVAADRFWCGTNSQAKAIPFFLTKIYIFENERVKPDFAYILTCPNLISNTS